MSKYYNFTCVFNIVNDLLPNKRIIVGAMQESNVRDFFAKQFRRCPRIDITVTTEYNAAVCQFTLDKNGIPMEPLVIISEGREKANFNDARVLNLDDLLDN